MNSFEVPSQIYLVSPGGGEPRVLIGGTGILTQFSPAWSPDGTMLALTHVDQIFTYFPDGTGRRQRVSQAFEPDWTPDGQFVFARPQAGFGSPLRIHVGTGASTRQLVPDVHEHDVRLRGAAEVRDAAAFISGLIARGNPSG